MITDIEAPAFSSTVNNISQLTDTNEVYATVTWSEPFASDNCDFVNLTSDYSSGDTFSIGNTLVTYTASDSSGNSRTSEFTVSVYSKFF